MPVTHIADEAAGHTDIPLCLGQAYQASSLDEKCSLRERIDPQALVRSGPDFKIETSTDTNVLSDSEAFVTNGEPVVNTGEDVSRYIVDIRDDGDNPLTFRSLYLGTIFAALSSVLGQVSTPTLPMFRLVTNRTDIFL